jgi:predicted metal-dependent hydrolase
MRNKNKSRKKHPNITIKQQRRKSMVMRISAAGDLVVHIPNWIHPNDSIVEKFIENAIDKIGDHLPKEKPVQLRDARDVLIMVERWAQHMDVLVGRVQFRPMTRKWGSCSSLGNITLNSSLFYLPEHLVEYVVVHELVHLLILDHSPRFWAKVGEFMADYEECEQELNGYRV